MYDLRDDFIIDETEGVYYNPTKDLEALERLIGTYESYGGWSSGKPAFSKDVLKENLCKE